jgi:hypothetical protein
MKTTIIVAVIAIVLLSSDAKLIEVGRQQKVKSILTGELHPDVQKMAERHATHQAQVQVQGHQGWNRRLTELRRLVPEVREWSEVANESWPGQDVNAAAREMYRSWRLSSDHWAAINGRCDYYGYSMRRGANGTWYACGIFGIK